MTIIFLDFSEPLEGIVLNITVRRTGSVTIDVNSLVWILNYDWETPEDFVVPNNTKIVTIKAYTNGSHVGGILASFSNNVVTDEAWLCMEKGENWENATTVKMNGTTSLPKPTGDDFSGDAATAQWIWVKNTSATNVACKRTFSKSNNSMLYKILATIFPLVPSIRCSGVA